MIHNITNFNVMSLEGTFSDDNQSEISYKYNVLYDEMFIHGDFNFDISILEIPYSHSGQVR